MAVRTSSGRAAPTPRPGSSLSRPDSPARTRSRSGPPRNIGYGFVVRINSANANVQLGASPPVGAEYFDANLTATNAGGRLSNLSLDFGFSAAGSHARYHTDDGHGCTDPGPQPALDAFDPFEPGEFRTGYVCWTIAAEDAGSLELYFGSGTFAAPRTTWFALH